MKSKYLYFFLTSVTLRRGAVAIATQRAGVARPPEHVARAVRSLLYARGAARRVSSLSARAAQRQSTEVDERDARAHQRPGYVPGLSALHHRRAVAGRARVAAAATGHPGTPRAC